MNLPVHLQGRQRRDLARIAIEGINGGPPPHISIGDNRFTLVDDAGNEKLVPTHHVDVCVIDANHAVSKIFYDPSKPYVKGGDNGPPICWSDNGIGASAQASQPQNTSCKLCPHDAWKTKGEGKACSDGKKLAVIVPGMEMVFLLRIPPASLKNFFKYTQTLAGHGVDLPDAVTRLEFESQGILKFTPQGYVDEATAAATDKAIAAKATDQLVGRLDRPWGGQADAQKIAYAQSQPAAQIAPIAPPPQPFATPAAETFGHAPAPQAPFVGSAQTAPAASSPFAPPSLGSQTDATPKERKPRGPNKPKADAQTVAAMNTGAAADGIPPFLQRNPEPAPAPAPNPTQFGMQAAPAAPDAGIQAALDAAFRLPT